MKGLKGILTVLGIAAGTMAVTLALLAPGSAGAVDQGAMRPLIAQPTLAVGGCTFTLESVEPADGKMHLRVKAANATDKPLDASAWLRLSASQKPDPNSRVMRLPQAVWTEKCVASLAPGETKTFTFTPVLEPAAGALLTATMSDGSQPAVGIARGIQLSVQRANLLQTNQTGS